MQFDIVSWIIGLFVGFGIGAKFGAWSFYKYLERREKAGEITITARTLTIIAFLFLAVPSVRGQFWLPEKEQDRLRSIWPEHLEFPDGLKFYNRTVWTQYAAYDPNRDQTGNVIGYFVKPFPINKDHVLVDNTLVRNPNMEFPYAVPGGLDKIPTNRWRSYVGVRMTKPMKMPWKNDVPTPQAFGGIVPKVQHEFRDDTMFVDLLTNPNTDDGERAFEIRTREKVNGKWVSERFKLAKEDRPVGYTGKLPKRCDQCHDVAEPNLYRIALRRMDGAFTFNPLVPGKLTVDLENVPVE